MALLDSHCNYSIMKCYNGIAAEGRLVPCGQCMNCRINKGRNWSSRILMEQYTTPFRSWFLTLTYSPENVPVTTDYVQTLQRRKFQTWIKNTYRDIGPFRYYAVGEYGDVSLRPHYHLAIFPQRDMPITLVTDKWKNGFTSAYELTAERARYLANYTTKKLTKETDERLAPGQEPEFRSSSKNPALGAAFIAPLVSRYSRGNGKELVETRGDVERTIRFDGKIYPIAPYILNKVREQLGIPLKHADRLCHPGYYEWHQTEEAEHCPTTLAAEEVIRHAQKKRRRLSETINV